MSEFSYPNSQPSWEDVNTAPFANNGELEDDQTVIDAFYAATEGDQDA